jgi:hypothetical protein
MRNITCLVTLTLSLVFLAGNVDAEDFWGKKLQDQPTEFIFGYGSLINSASRNSSASKPIAAIPVRVSASFGYIRVWNDRSSSGFTALGLRRPAAGEHAMTINGVLYPADGGDMSAFDAREKGYVRVEVPREDIEALSWQGLPAHGKIWVYIPDVAGKQPGIDLPKADAQYPLLESYIDIVLEGGLEYGLDYARELVETTKDWSAYWLNDRRLARRPWVFDKKYNTIDKLLSERAPSFSQRRFSEDYAATYLLKK